MTLPDAIKIQKQIEQILVANNIHYKVEMVKQPDIRFINFTSISIKITEK